jgi:hypothetical protein
MKVENPNMSVEKPNGLTAIVVQYGMIATTSTTTTTKTPQKPPP